MLDIPSRMSDLSNECFGVGDGMLLPLAQSSVLHSWRVCVREEGKRDVRCYMNGGKALLRLTCTSESVALSRQMMGLTKDDSSRSVIYSDNPAGRWIPFASCFAYFCKQNWSSFGVAGNVGIRGEVRMLFDIMIVGRKPDQPC